MKGFFVVFNVFFVFVQSAYEGEFCNNYGATGRCTSIAKCPTAMEDIRNRRPPESCGFDASGPVVCCVSSPIAQSTTRQPILTTTKRSPSRTTTTYVPPVYDYVDVGDRSDGCEPLPSSLTAPKNGNKAWDKCIEYQQQLVFPCNRSNALAGGLTRTNNCHHNADELIVGGVNANKNEFPHMALLGYGDNVNDLKWLCGGTLISDKFILTAGHCIASRDEGPVTYVALGRYKRGDDPTGRHRYRVKRIIKHPSYAPPIKYNDIALLELDRQVALDEFVVPACIHTGDPVDEQRASATGWGLTQDKGTTSDILQKVILKKFDTLECIFTYPPARLLERGFDAETQICYGDNNKPKDTCQGDSGGPLQIKSKKIVCMYVVVGVTSFGRGCGYVSQPGIYTRVANYADWIAGIVWP